MLRHVWSKQACAPSKKTVQSRSKLSVVVTASCEHQSHNTLFMLGVFTLLFCLLVVGFMQLGRGPSPYASCGWPAPLPHNRRGLTFIKITLNLNPPHPYPTPTSPAWTVISKHTPAAQRLPPAIATANNARLRNLAAPHPHHHPHPHPCMCAQLSLETI